MMTITALLVAAATTGDGPNWPPHAGGTHVYRTNVVSDSPIGGGMHPFSYDGMGAGAGPGGFAGIGSRSRRFVTTTTQIGFVEPRGMNIAWQTGGGGANEPAVYGPSSLVAPARYNFNQGYIYRLKLSNLPGRPGLNLYPTIEVAPATPMTDAFLAHNAIPLQFTEEDFDQVAAGNFVTKVIYLPDPKYQELAIAGVETLVSTRLEPGVDPILEADKRGTILMIVRLGGIDLEMGPETLFNGAEEAGAATPAPVEVGAATEPYIPPPVPPARLGVGSAFDAPPIP